MPIFSRFVYLNLIRVVSACNGSCNFQIVPSILFSSCSLFLRSNLPEVVTLILKIKKA